MTKTEGTGFRSGSICQRHGSADPDPDPHQNVMDTQHAENDEERNSPLKMYKDGLKILVRLKMWVIGRNEKETPP
jgi:hypothetical protein